MSLSYSNYGDYIKHLKINNEPLDYSAYVKSQLASIEKSYADAVSDAKFNLATSSVGYGKSGERLGSRGLLGGGYAEYLSGISKNKYLGELSDAAELREGDLKAARQGYRDYITKYNSAQQKLYLRVVSDMTASDMRNLGELIEYANRAGLSNEYALSAANAAASAITERLKKSVIDAINSEGFSERESYEYAVSLGLSAELARELSDYAKRKNDIQINDDYLSGIKNKS